MPISEDALATYARLLLEVGVNLAPGQLLQVDAYLEAAPLVRAVAREAYRMGAFRVDAEYIDPHVSRALTEFGPEESLSWSSPWQLERQAELARTRGARIQISGHPAPDVMAGLDPKRIARSLAAEYLRRWTQMVGDRACAWVIAAYPTEAWATQVFGEPDVERLWRSIQVAVRLDEPDPPEAWRRHVERLRTIALELTRRRFDALHFEGPGTDLTVGLFQGCTWGSAGDETAWGTPVVVNMPTEEVYTSPDPRRTTGRVRSTRPLAHRGTVVRDLEMVFEAGRVIEVRASEGADVIQSDIAADEGAARLGEVALVDDASAVGRQNLVFFNTLFDENATCHIAYGNGFDYAISDPAERANLNRSGVHVDFMIGGPEVDVTGITTGGERVPVIRRNRFQIP